MVWLLLCILALQWRLLGRREARIYGTFATPFSLLLGPFLAVCFAIAVLARTLDFVLMSPAALALWAVGLALVWGAGQFLGWGICDVRLPRPRPTVGRTAGEDIAAKWAMYIAWFIAPVIAYGVYSSARSSGGWTQLGSLEFRIAFSHGIHSHAVVLALPLLIVLIGTYEKGYRSQLLTIIGLIVLITFSQVKGTIAQPLIGGLIFAHLRGRFRLTVKKFVIAAAGWYAVFNIVYLIGVAASHSSDLLDSGSYIYLARHFFFYAFAGPLSLSEALRNGISHVGGDWTSIFSPVINLYREVFRPEVLTSVGSSVEKGMDIDLLGYAEDAGTNVYTFFGTIFLYLGTAAGALYVIVAALLSYGLLIAARIRHDEWLLAAYCIIAAQFGLGFFEFYLWHLTPYEALGYCFLLGVLSASRSRARTERFAASAHTLRT